MVETLSQILDETLIMYNSVLAQPKDYRVLVASYQCTAVKEDEPNCKGFVSNQSGRCCYANLEHGQKTCLQMGSFNGIRTT